MIIQTKYRIGNIVYSIHNNIIIIGKIKSILCTINPNTIKYTIGSYGSIKNLKKGCFVVEIIQKNEVELYSTKQELISSL